MRSLFLFLFAFSGTIAAFGQNFQIGLNGGIGYNTAPGIISESSIAPVSQKHSDVSSLAAIKAMLDHNKWQYGIQAANMQLSYKAHENGVFMPGTGYPISTTSVFISKEAIPVKLFVNRKIAFQHLETYAGISAGYVLAKDCQDPAALAEEYYNHVNGNGFSAGLQIGGTYFITKRIGVNAEIGGDYMAITIGAATYKLYEFPATVGIRYRL